MIQEDVRALLREDYSPKQVNGTLKKQGIETVSTERIYQLIWTDKKSGGNLHTYLRRQGRRYRKRGAAKDSRGIIKNIISVKKKPEIMDKRERFGDIEVDLIIGKNHNQALFNN